MEDTFTCPRRLENGNPEAYGGLNSDTYREGRGGLVGQARGCSYCGSMSPDDFMEAVRAGTKIGPTDKNYKAYVGEMEGKFYFQHLSDDQKKEFIDLLNDKKVNLGYPGYFYNLPYFASVAPKEG